MAATAIFAVAAVAHMLRYVLLLVNRTMLLPPWVAVPGVLMGVLASLAAGVTVVIVTVVMTSWLIGSRAAAYGEYGRDDPRPAWMLWAGCLIPLISLFWAPVFLIELAHVQGAEDRQRKTITAWWVAWAFSTLTAVWAIWTRWATEPQAVADNTVTMVVAYLAGTGTLLLLWRMFDGFVGKQVQRPQHRWVVVAEHTADSENPVGESPAGQAAGHRAPQEEGPGEKGPERQSESGRKVESRDREPAA